MIRFILVYFFCSIIIAERYPLSQKPFIADYNPDDTFTRGTYLFVAADSEIEDKLTNLSYGNFSKFKKTQGYNVEIWNFENIGSAADLRDSLHNYYNNIYAEGNVNPLEYVLLIGDYDPDSPISNPIIDSYTISSYNEQQDDVTDHPYTYFDGGVETEDGLHPKYFIGRWSIATNSELRNIINKTIQYVKRELTQDPSYVDRALLVAGSYKSNDGTEVFPHSWPVSPVWTSLWLQDRLTQYGYSTVDTAFFHMGNMQTSNPTISDAWNSGVGIINYRGWGNVQGWVKPQFFISPDIANLNYTFNLPVVFSFVCNTGDFGNDVEPSFGEALIRAGSYSAGGKGAVAVVAPSDLDTDTRFNNVLCGALWDGLLEGRTPELGQALYEAKQAVGTEFEGISETGLGGTQNIPVFYHHVYGILGDPSLPVWLQTPSEILIYDNNENMVIDTLNLSDRFITVKLQNDSGEDLHDVVGALLYGDELIAKGLSTYEGYLDIDFSSIEIIDIGSEMELYLNKAQFSQKKINLILSSDTGDAVENHIYDQPANDPDNYYEVSEVAYSWIELNPEEGGMGENLYLTDDVIAKDIPIGFNFNYYGNSYSTINICSNGWAAFEEIDIPYFWNFSIPFSMGPHAMLAVFYDDLDDNGKESFIDNNSNYMYDESVDEFITDCGTANNPTDPYICHDYNQNGLHDDGEPFNVFKWHDIDNNRFIVQWDDLSNAEDDENCETTGCVKETFQMILYDPVYDNSYGQGNIIFQYKEIHDIDDGRVGKNGNLSTIGIESPDQNKGIQYLFRGTFQNGESLVDGGLNETAIKFSANQVMLDIEDITIYQPSEIQLIYAYPNPFNPVTTILYTLTNMSWLDLSVYNIRGQKVINLYKGAQLHGTHEINWDASAYASGVYFITLTTENTKLTQKVLLLK